MRGPRADALWEVLSGAVDALAGGDECTVHGYDLPDDHPERDAGAPGGHLVLTADDELRPAA